MHSISRVIFLFSFSLSIHAAESLRLQHVSLPQLEKIIYLNLNNSKSTLANPNELKLKKTRVDFKDTTHRRFEQLYLGYKVFGGMAILHNTKSGKTKLNGLVFKELQTDLGENPPFSKALAKNLYLNFTKTFSKSIIKSKEIEPIIYIQKDKAHWAYKISILLQSSNEIPTKPTAIIDAKTFKKLESWNDIKTYRELVNGIGFGGNQKIGRYQFGVKLPFLEISRDDFSGMCYLENRDITVVDMHFKYQSANAPMAFTCPYSEDFNAYWTGYDENGFDFINGGYSPSNDALYIGSLIKKMYKQAYGVEVLEQNYQPTRLIMRVHYGKGFANAFWDGQNMTFGDGDTFLHPLVSLGIGAHEVSHGLTEQNSNLAYFGQSGGINESFSDMAAQAIEYYVNKKNSWSIGGDILKPAFPLSALRFMDKPSLDGHSIDSAYDYRNNLDVHHSSGVYNRLFYLLATTQNWSTHKAFQVMLKANLDYWSTKSDFSDAACGIIYAAEDLDYNIADIKKNLDEVMIDYDLC
ncbi:MAG: hypothetical protein A3E88_07370 [Legionellales bacterium RIFCSPHIGHO2_12_FULL_35_11]|nr:MAG: hypothetical protein A3E88_07370 [Legionellales bacterium RIFCSPHIGHO2_12_FULL_35_11]